MRIKLFQIKGWYIRFDLTILDGFNCLLGFNTCEGGYIACTDETRSDCREFEFSEFQIGFLLFTISTGKEYNL